MILNIFTEMWSKITEWSNQFYDFIMNHYDEPFLWIIIFAILLVIAYAAISNLGNK